MRRRVSVLARLSFSPQSVKVCSSRRSAVGNSASVAMVAVSSANSRSPKMCILLFVCAWYAVRRRVSLPSTKIFHCIPGVIPAAVADLLRRARKSCRTA